MKPVAFLILTSLLFTVIAHYFHADEVYNEKEKIQLEGSSIEGILQWIQTHYGYANILSVGFYALCVKLLFRKYPYNIYEITIMLCFVMGQAMLLLTVETFFFGLIGDQAYKIILSAIALAYPTWAIGQFFDQSKPISYIKALLAYLLGYLLFFAVIILLGLSYDLAMKMLGS